MQVRRSSFSGNRPSCPLDCPLCRGDGKIHRHDSYERFRSPEGSEQVRVQRYRCQKCKKTLSVVEELLPYRALEVKVLQEHLDQIVSSGPDPPQLPVKTREVLSRAVERFVQRAEVLKAAAGLKIEHCQSPAALWKELRTALGDLESILRFLGRQIKASLLGDYRCLRGWWTFAQGLL